METTTVVMDKHGRLYLPKKIQQDMGRKFYVAKTREEIILVPVPKDPIKELRELGKKSGINRLSNKQIKKIIMKEAEKEIAEELA